MDKKNINTQIAVFFKSDYIGPIENVSLKFKEKLNGGNTNFLPVPNNAPKEFPRFIFNYEHLTINFFPHRVDFYFADSFELDIMSNILSVLIDDLKLVIGRIGFVKRSFVKKDVTVLKDMLPKEKIIGLDIKEMNLRINIRSKIDTYDCNNIEQIDPGEITLPNGDREIGLICLRDLNTLSEKISEYIFTKEDIVKLVSLFNQELDKPILMSYAV